MGKYESTIFQKLKQNQILKNKTRKMYFIKKKQKSKIVWQLIKEKNRTITTIIIIIEENQVKSIYGT